MLQVIEENGLRIVQILQRGRNARTGAKESQISLILAERPGPRAPRRPRSKTPILDERRARSTIQREFARIALFPGRSHPWRVGMDHALALGYPLDLLQALPRTAVESFSGVACPIEAMALRPGEAVVDVGAGSGVDAFLAARIVGDCGQVVGIEMTEELLRRAAAVARQARVTNLRFEKGLAEDLPLPDSFADVVLANGVVNLLVVRKEQAIGEAWRVLKPGGRFVLADVVVEMIATTEARATPERWASGLAGPVTEAELLDLLHDVGFSEIEIVPRGDPFVGGELEHAARSVGASGVVVVARKLSLGDESR